VDRRLVVAPYIECPECVGNAVISRGGFLVVCEHCHGLGRLHREGFEPKQRDDLAWLDFMLGGPLKITIQ